MGPRFLAVAVALLALPAQAAYRCVDDKGMTHFGDTPPAACKGVPIHEISKSGTVKRTIDPTPSAEEIARRKEEAARKREEEREREEQKRRDMTLLQTFTTEREFDVALERNVEPLKGRIRLAQDRIKALDKRLGDIAEEMEFYKAGKSSKAKVAAGKAANEPPRPLLDERERLANEKAGLERTIAGYERDIEALRKRYETDKTRWVTLKRGAAPPATPVPATKN